MGVTPPSVWDSWESPSGDSGQGKSVARAGITRPLPGPLCPSVLQWASFIPIGPSTAASWPSLKAFTAVSPPLTSTSAKSEHSPPVSADRSHLKRNFVTGEGEERREEERGKGAVVV